MATWCTLIALLSVHLATNYAAVRAVSMRCLNRQRANIVLSRILEHGHVLGPADVSRRERIFERDGVLRWVDDRIIGHCRIGVSVGAILQDMNTQRRHRQTGSLELQSVKLSDLMRVYDDEAYILWFGQSGEALIALKQGCTTIDQLKAWMHALLLASRAKANAVERQHVGDSAGAEGAPLAELRMTLEQTRKAFDTCADKLRDMGWDLDTAALETRAGTRAAIGPNKDV